MRPAGRSALSLAAVLVLSTCSSPTEPPTPPGEEPPPGGGPLPPMTELELTLTDSLEVHGYVWMRATGRAANGAVVAPPEPIRYSTSDATIATVSSEGVVYGQGRGRVTITASSGSVQGNLTLTVRARVVVTFASGLALESYRIAVGDTLPLVASFVDIDGVPIEGEAAPGTATWSSSDPATVSVDQDGRAIGHQPFGFAVVTATTVGEGSASTTVLVDGTQAGLPATVRFANGAPEQGPVTFRPSRGGPVTLSPGESVDIAVGSGFFYVTLDVLPGQEPMQPWLVLIPPDGELSLYAVGRPNLYLAPLWGPTEVVPDMGMVRLVQGSGYLVVYLRSRGEAIEGVPEQCYFDPGLSTPYYMRPPEPFDLFLQAKYQATDSVRLTADAPAGRPVTLVLTGSSPETAGYIAFPDR